MNEGPWDCCKPLKELLGQRAETQECLREFKFRSMEQEAGSRAALTMALYTQMSPDAPKPFWEETNKIETGKEQRVRENFHESKENVQGSQADPFSALRITCIKHFLNQTKFVIIPSEVINCGSIAEPWPSSRTRVPLIIIPRGTKGVEMQAQHSAPIQLKRKRSTLPAKAALLQTGHGRP